MTFGFTLTEVAGATAIAGGLNSLTGGSITNALGLGKAGAPNTAAGQSTAADPYGQYRPGDAALLQQYYNNPNMITSDPGYQAQTQAGEAAVTRQMAATEQSQSGNEQIALQQYGQGTFSNYRQQMINNLMMSSGASTSPANATSATTGQNTLQSNLFTSGLAGAASGLGGLSVLYGSSKSTPTPWGSPVAGVGTQQSIMDAYGNIPEGMDMSGAV